MRKNICLLFVLFLVISSGMAQNEALLFGKTMLVLGDSYVKNHRRPVTETWHYKLAEKYHMDYRNYGRNGSSIAFDRSREGFGPPMYLRYKDMTDTADYVIVIAGHNDADMIDRYAAAYRDSTGSKTKNPAEREALDTFKLRMKELCQGLREKYSHAEIAFFTPWDLNQRGFKLVIPAMKKICAEYSIPIYNAAKKSGIKAEDESFRKQYFQSPKDKAHLNNAGHDLFMGRAEQFLLGL